VEREEYDELLRRLTTLVAHLDGYITSQDARNERLDQYMARMDTYMARQDTINERLERTLHAITLILGRDNGR
jgi:hypothetical protein